MTKKPTISNISSGYASTTTLNNNFTALRDKFENTLSRDGSTPNAMAADLDMNSNDIQNVNALDVQSLTVGGTNFTNVINSESAAAASATAAANSASAASSSETAAQSAQTAAEAAYDSFDDRYLGAKSSAPSVDNDGNALLTGALYWNSTGDQLYVWDGSAWNAAGFVASGAVSSFNTRTGAVTLSAADVSGATGLLSTNNLSDLGSASTARDNLTLGTSDSVTFGEISLADNAYIKLGDNDELNIFSNSGSSKISETGSGNFTIEGDNLILQATSGSNYFYGTADGQVRLFYNDDTKLTTTNTGVKIEGDLTVNRTGGYNVDLNDLRGYVSVKEYGAEGDGSTNDAQAFVDAMASGRTVLVPAGTYLVSTSMTFSGHFIFEEGAKIKANAALVFNMSIQAGQYQIGEHGTGSIEWSIPHDICVEWLGVTTSNTASTNKTNYENFLKYSNPSTYPYVVKFGRGRYRYEAPFYITSRIAVEGQTMFASELEMSGSDEHGVESCEIDSNSILTDGTMAASTVYSHFRNMEVDCSDMIFTGDIKKFMFYGVGVSSSIIEGNRFGCNGSFQNNMDGIFLGPTYFSEVTDNTKNRSSNRNTVRNNRITNFRDGIVLGRHSQSKTDREPAGGGTGDFVGGACFENTIGPRNILRGSGTEAARPRFGIVAHYYNIDGSSAPNARAKPYANNVYGNTILEFDSGTSNLTGTIAVSSGSATVTGTGTSFTSELPNDITSGVNRRLAIGFTHSGTDYMFEVDSIDSDTQLTLKSADLPNITQSGLTVDTVRSGVALFTGSEGQNMVFRDHYVDHWCFPIQLTSNANGASFYDNHTAGNPLLHLDDNSEADSAVNIRVHTPAFETRTNGVKDNSESFNRSYFKGRTIVYGSEFEEGPELTISGGAITVTQNYHQVDTQGDASTDDLDTINGGTVGQILILRAQNDSRTVVLKDGTGNLKLSGDFSLDDLDDTITLIYTGSNWLEVATANNA